MTRETAQEDIRWFLDVLRKNRILEKEPGESEPEGGTVRMVIRK